jgi:hypothetical protein
VLASLVRALRLSDDERSHLFRLAGHADPRPGTIDRHITPSMQRHGSATNTQQTLGWWHAPMQGHHPRPVG